MPKVPFLLQASRLSALPRPLEQRRTSGGKTSVGLGPSGGRPAILRVPQGRCAEDCVSPGGVPSEYLSHLECRSASSRILRRAGPMRKGLRIGIRGMPSGPAPPSSPGFPGRPSRKDLACRPRTDAHRIAYRWAACRPASSFAGRRAGDRGPFSSCSPAARRRKCACPEDRCAEDCVSLRRHRPHARLSVASRGMGTRNSSLSSAAPPLLQRSKHPSSAPPNSRSSWSS